MEYHVEAISADPPPLPKRAVLRQRWCELAYFHWRYDPAEVQRLLPRNVTVDTFDGSAWVGLIPFEMRNVQVGPTPPLPWLSSFIEINVRTYVVDAQGRRAVWFFSLDVPRSVIVGVARTAFALPYCWASARHSQRDSRHRYHMKRRWPRAVPAAADIAFNVGQEIEAPDVDELSHFLSARWALLTSRGKQLLYGAVHHERWPLHQVSEVRIDQSVLQAAGLSDPGQPSHALYSPGVSVEVSWFDKIA